MIIQRGNQYDALRSVEGICAHGIAATAGKGELNSLVFVAVNLNKPCERRHPRRIQMRMQLLPKENLMRLKSTILSLILCLAVSAPPSALAQGTGTPNASTSSGAANADTMAPGGTGNAVPKGAGDTSASGVSPAGNTKGMKKKSVKNKSPAAADSGTNQASKPAQ